MICAFFGHQDTPWDIQPHLENLLKDLIVHWHATVFYVGHQGNFDRIVWKTLENLQQRYPYIQIAIVLAYLPTQRNQHNFSHKNTVYPDGLENVPPKFAISHRNRWMIKQADTVITYIVHNHGGAAQCKNTAEKQGKHIINMPDIIKKEQA
ncbi:MAG: hypothetical protein IJ465_06055 [Clostridia bacterium]|nr:hypothetical protein [Clostridia bacterium]